MKSSMALLAVGGAVLATGVAVYAWQNQDKSGSDILDLPSPNDNECATSEDVWNATIEVVKDESFTSADLRAAARALREGGNYCDSEARTMAITCAGILEARADTLDNVDPGSEGTQPTAVPPSPIAIPGGHYYAGLGWCMPGAVLDLSTGMCTFQPWDLPAPQPSIMTSGACCASCADGHECEEDCVS